MSSATGGSVPISAQSLEREISRSVRFEYEEVEQKLLDLADPLLKGRMIALLATACRLGALLSLQTRLSRFDEAGVPTRHELMVRKGGLEPPRYCYRQPLKLVKVLR